MNIPKSAIEPFGVVGIPTLNIVEPPVRDWGEGIIWGEGMKDHSGWTPGPDEGGSFWAPYIPMIVHK